MSSVLREPVLVLSRTWQVDSFTDVENAIVTVFRDRASILDTRDYLLMDFETWVDYDPPDDYSFVQTPTFKVPAPQIIVLKFFGEKVLRKLCFSKRSVHLRDLYRCLYCNRELPGNELTLDHVIPRSRFPRGTNPTTFENIATACEPCNRRKANFLPEEAGMKLAYPPYSPEWTPKVKLPGHTKLKPTWFPFLEKEKLI